jgi:hypothetical protein
MIAQKLCDELNVAVKVMNGIELGEYIVDLCRKYKTEDVLDINSEALWSVEGCFICLINKQFTLGK